MSGGIDDSGDKKILIVGWNASRNFGTTLQSLALYKVLSERYECSLLWERRYLPLSAILKHISLRKRRSLSTQSDGDTQKKVLECYECADKVYINSRKQLNTVLKRFSVFLVGGDQLWNPYLAEDTYFLDFVPDGRRKISYATSSGIAIIPREREGLYKKFLCGFDCVSMRDGRGAQAVSAIIGKPVVTVADPVFLLSVEQWQEFAGQATVEAEERFALLYFVGDGVENRMEAMRVARRENIPVAVIPMSEYDGNLGADKVLKGIGPREFVNLISRADRIYTDSYHACAFSLIFGKAFTVYKRFPYSVPENPNARVDELLSAFGLGGERCNVESFGGDREAYVPIIERMREFSLNYLFNSVEGI